MKKNNISIYWIISLVLFSALLLGILIGNNNSENYPDKIYLSPTFIVKDSAEFNKISKQTNSDINQYTSETIEKIVAKEFDRTTNYLNWTIVLFAIFLTIIIVVFGFFTVTKMNESKALLEDILAAPDAVMKKYYTNQLNDLIPNLISTKNTLKYQTISNLYSNTELVKEKHYDLISDVMVREFDNHTSYSKWNILSLFEILCRLDYSKTIDLGYEIFDTYPEHQSFELIIPILNESNEKKHKEKLISYICDSSNQNKFYKLTSYIHNFEAFNIDTLNYISKNASEQNFFHVLRIIGNKYTGKIDLIPVIKNLGDRYFIYNNLDSIIHALQFNKQIDKTILLEILERVKCDSSSELMFIEFLRVINNYITDKTLKDEALTTIMKKFCRIDLKQVQKNLETNMNQHLGEIIQLIIDKSKELES